VDAAVWQVRVQKELTMNFGALKEAGGAVLDKVQQKANETMNDANKLLALLQDAGYQVEEFEVEVKAIPKLTIGVKATTAVSDTKLEAIIKANKENDVIVMVLTALEQANRFRSRVDLKTIELKSLKIEIEGTPSVKLQWKEKEAAAAAAGS
jgi:hypothetical protein